MHIYTQSLPSRLRHSVVVRHSETVIWLRLQRKVHGETEQKWRTKESREG